MSQYSLTAVRSASSLPSLQMIGDRILELRKRSVLMAVTVAFTMGVPVIFYGIREISHLADPAHYGPAGTTSAFAIVVSLMAEFGFILAVLLGASAGTDDLTNGMFRQLVITGRSRVALYLARIPAGLSILLPLAAVGFTVAALVTGFLNSPHAPGAVVPSAAALTEAGLWLGLYLIVGFTVSLGLAVLMGQDPPKDIGRIARVAPNQLARTDQPGKGADGAFPNTPGTCGTKARRGSSSAGVGRRWRDAVIAQGSGAEAAVRLANGSQLGQELVELFLPGPRLG